MKGLCFVFLFILYSFSSGLAAQTTTQGIYLTAKDFKNGKLSYANNQDNKKYRLYLNDIFNSPSVKIAIGDSIINLKKDEIFGYRDKNNLSYRFFKNIAYKILNPSEKILLYCRTYTTGGTKSNHTVTDYFFSSSADSPMYALSKSNLKTVLYSDIRFHELLDVEFHSDNELYAYDSINKIYNLNRIYELSKQKVN
jgi:hypothetical protein